MDLSQSFVRVFTVRVLSLFLFLLFGAWNSAFAQQNSLIRKYFSSFENDTTNLAKAQFLVYPTLGFSPETNLEIGLSGLYLYYQNQDTSNRLSEITGRMFYTLENQYGAFVEHALYSQGNRWFFLGNFRYQNFPLSFFGVGIESPKEDEQLVSAKQFLIKERILREVKKNFYVGLELEYNRTSEVVFSKPENLIFESPLYGTAGFTNFSSGLGLVLDSRHNVLNVREGYFSELALLNSSRNLGSDYSFGVLLSDSRLFKTVRKNQVLAAQLVGQFSWGEVPYNQLPQLGGPNLMRGYYQGRFRDRNMLAGQVEYRFLPFNLGFTNRIGGAVFASMGTVYNQFDQIELNDFKGAVGGGLRFLLFPQKDIFVRFDFAMTREGNAFYVFIGEAF